MSYYPNTSKDPKYFNLTAIQLRFRCIFRDPSPAGLLDVPFRHKTDIGNMTILHNYWKKYTPKLNILPQSSFTKINKNSTSYRFHKHIKTLQLINQHIAEQKQLQVKNVLAQPARQRDFRPDLKMKLLKKAHILSKDLIGII